MTMKMQVLGCVVAGVVVGALVHLGAQAPSQPAPVVHAISADRALPLTCAQAWVVSGKNYASVVEIIKSLAKVSLENRDLTFPNTREAGMDAGRGIADDCKADPSALLYAVVDKHVRRVAEPLPR